MQVLTPEPVGLTTLILTAAAPIVFQAPALSKKIRPPPYSSRYARALLIDFFVFWRHHYSQTQYQQTGANAGVKRAHPADCSNANDFRDTLPQKRHPRYRQPRGNSVR